MTVTHQLVDADGLGPRRCVVFADPLCVLVHAFVDMLGLFWCVVACNVCCEVEMPVARVLSIDCACSACLCIDCVPACLS